MATLLCQIASRLHADEQAGLSEILDDARDDGLSCGWLILIQNKAALRCLDMMITNEGTQLSCVQDVESQYACTGPYHLREAQDPEELVEQAVIVARRAVAVAHPVEVGDRRPIYSVSQRQWYGSVGCGTERPLQTRREAIECLWSVQLPWQEPEPCSHVQEVDAINRLSREIAREDRLWYEKPAGPGEGVLAIQQGIENQIFVFGQNCLQPLRIVAQQLRVLQDGSQMWIAVYNPFDRGAQQSDDEGCRSIGARTN